VGEESWSTSSMFILIDLVVESVEECCEVDDIEYWESVNKSMLEQVFIINVYKLIILQYQN
jgi:hypothetical protein